VAGVFCRFGGKTSWTLTSLFPFPFSSFPNSEVLSYSVVSGALLLNIYVACILNTKAQAQAGFIKKGCLTRTAAVQSCLRIWSNQAICIYKMFINNNKEKMFDYHLTMHHALLMLTFFASFICTAAWYRGITIVNLHQCIPFNPLTISPTNRIFQEIC
jgi:hypothetical protein